MLHSKINKLVLCFSLDHSRSLGPYHLNGPLNINLTIKSLLLNLIDDHVNDNESSSPSYASAKAGERKRKYLKMTNMKMSRVC